MIPGKPLQKPVGKIWTSAYMDSKTEIYEIRTEIARHPEAFQTLYHKEYPLGTSLADFLYSELKAFDDQLPAIRQQIEDINAGRNIEHSFTVLFDVTMYWLRQSALFAPFGAAVQRLHLVHENGVQLATDELEQLMAYYNDFQRNLRAMVDIYYPADASADMAKRYFEQQREHGEKLFPQLVFHNVRFGPVSKGANGFFPYDNLLNTIMSNSPEDESRCELVDFIG
jgi:hypothetical protein